MKSSEKNSLWQTQGLFYASFCGLLVYCRLETERDLSICQRLNVNATQLLCLSASCCRYRTSLLHISHMIVKPSSFFYTKSTKFSLDSFILRFYVHYCIVRTHEYFFSCISLRSWDAFFKFLCVPSFVSLKFAKM